MMIFQCNMWRSYYIGLVKRAVVGTDGVLRVQVSH